MTDLKFAILEHLYKNGRSDEFRNLYTVNPNDTNAVFYAIQEFESMQLLNITPNYDWVSLTTLGATAYEEEKEARQKNAQYKKQQRFDNKMAIASVLISLISFFSGIIVESQIDLFDWVLSLFH